MPVVPYSESILKSNDTKVWGGGGVRQLIFIIGLSLTNVFLVNISNIAEKCLS